MRKKRAWIVSIVIILVLVILGYTFIKMNSKKTNTTLYEEAIKYLQKKNDSKNKNKKDWKVFMSYKGFGIDKEEEYQYAYMWILEEAYYINEDGQLQLDTGSVMPYKFTFKDKKVIKYEKPETGENYKTSVGELFPKKISQKILDYKFEELSKKNIKKIKENYN